MKAINLSPEAMKIVNDLCDPSELDARISALEEAEDELQKIAYDMDANDGYRVYCVAYTLKIYKNEYVKLKSLLTDGNQGI